MKSYATNEPAMYSQSLFQMTRYLQCEENTLTLILQCLMIPNKWYASEYVFRLLINNYYQDEDNDDFNSCAEWKGKSVEHRDYSRRLVTVIRVKSLR